MCIKTYSRHRCCDARANTGTMQLCRNFVRTRRCQEGRTNAWNGEYTELACPLHANSQTLDLRVSRDGAANSQINGHRSAAEHRQNGTAQIYMNGNHNELEHFQDGTADNYVNGYNNATERNQNGSTPSHDSGYEDATEHIQDKEQEDQNGSMAGDHQSST